jgi:hypothetical protein
MYFIGFLLVILAILFWVLIPSDVEKRKKINWLPSFFNEWTNKNVLMLLFFGLGIIVFSESFFIGKESKQYYILNKATGARNAVMSPGLHFITPFVTQVREWDKYLEIKGVKINKKGELIGSDKEIQALEDVEGPIRGGISVRFIDRVTAQVYPSVRFQLPSDPKAFIKIVETYRTPENLVMNTLVPTVSEQLKNITFMFTADEYVSGGATIYRSEIEDVLKNGAYIFEKQKIRDTIFSEPSINGDTISVKNRKRDIREIKTYEKNAKVLKDGVALRKKHEITDNKIITVQVIIDDISLEKSYEQKLSQQRDLAAEAIVEEQKILTARKAQGRILAEGERDKAKERVTQEKAQITKLISIETQVKEEESKRQLAEINVKTEELKSKATKIAADAEAYKNAKLVQAGLTPLERAKIEKETAIEVAKQLKDMKTPEIIIMGDGKSSPTEALLQTKLIKDIISKNKK